MPCIHSCLKALLYIETKGISYSRGNNNVSCLFTLASQHWHSKDLMGIRNDLEYIKYNDCTVACEICQNFDDAASNEFTTLKRVLSIIGK